MEINALAVIVEFLSTVFQNLSNLTFKVLEVNEKDSIARIKVFKKTSCFYNYEEIKEALSNDCVIKFNNESLLVRTDAKRGDLKDEILLNYKIERCEV